MAAVGVGMASRLLQGHMAPLRAEVAATDRPMACMGLHLQVNNSDEGCLAGSGHASASLGKKCEKVEHVLLQKKSPPW